MSKKIRGAVFGPCLGVGGGDSFMSSLIAHTWETVDWTGVFVGGGASWEQYERARRQTAGRVKFHQTTGRLERRGDDKSPHAKYHDTPLEAARAAAKSADFVISWHCEQTAEFALDSAFSEVAFIELIQNEDDYAKNVAHESVHYAYRYVAVSQKAGMETYGDVTRFDVLPNGVEMDRILPKLGRANTRKIWGIEEDKFVILFAGRFSNEKNPEAILEAMELLPENYVALFVGSGLLEGVIESRAARSFDHRVWMLPSMYHLGDVYAASDVFVLVSDFEGDSLAWKEAMCAGLPCICSDVGSVRETVESSGWVLTTILNPRPSRYVLSDAIKEVNAERIRDTTGEDRNHRRGYALANFTISSRATAWAAYLTNVVADWKKERAAIHLDRRIERAESQREGSLHQIQGTPITRIGEQRVQVGPNQQKVVEAVKWDETTSGVREEFSLEEQTDQASGIEPSPELDQRVREAQGVPVEVEEPIVDDFQFVSYSAAAALCRNMSTDQDEVLTLIKSGLDLDKFEGFSAVHKSLLLNEFQMKYVASVTELEKRGCVTITYEGIVGLTDLGIHRLRQEKTEPPLAEVDQ